MGLCEESDLLVRLQGGMHHVGLAPLAGAVSRAGGLGCVTALSLQTPELLRDELRKAKDLSEGKPIGVNLTLLPMLVPPDYDKYLDVVIEEQIPVVETAGHVKGLQPFVDRLKAEGRFVIHKCTSVRHAKSAQKMGVDMISMDGFECAGHPGETDVGNWVLQVQAKQELDIPFITSGGCATGSQLAASLALGAAGMNMGTRFMATQEAPIHQNVKQAIQEGQVSSTRLIMRSMRNTERVYNNEAAQELLKIEAEHPGDFERVKHLVQGSIYKKVFHETGDLEEGIWSAGICMGIIHDCPTCQTLIDGIVAEAIDIMQNKLVNAIVQE